MNAPVLAPAPEDMDPVLRALARAQSREPRALTPEQLAFIKDCEREAAGEPRIRTLDEVLDGIAQNAREQGYSEDEIQAHVYGAAAR